MGLRRSENITKLGNEVYLKVFQASVHLIVEVLIPSKEFNLRFKINLRYLYIHFYLAPDEEI